MSDPNWISAFLSDRNALYLTSLAITMSQIDDSWNEEENRIPDAEPLPFIDYNLIQNIVSLPGSKLDKWEVEGFASVIQARKLYYAAHNKFQYEYNGLQDARIYDTMLKAEKKELEDMGEEKDAKLREKLEWTKIGIQRNQKDIEECLKKVRARWIKRNHSMAEFRRMKTDFVETMLPQLIEASEKPDVKALLTSSSAAVPIPAPINPLILTSTPSPPTLTSTPSSPTLTSTPNPDPMESESVEPKDPMEVDENEIQADVDAAAKTQNPSDDTQTASDAAKNPPRTNPFGERIVSASDLWYNQMN